MDVSVVICTYNGGKFIRQQIASILSQTYPPAEIIIQDDCSTDDTVQVIEDMAAKDNRIEFFKTEKHSGVNVNFVTAIARAGCEFIAWSDQDDIWRVDKLEKQLKEFQRNLGLWVCFHITQPFVNEYPDIQKPYDKRMPNFGLERTLFLGTTPGHTMMFKKELRDFFSNRIPDNVFAKASESFYYDTMLSIVANAYGRVQCIVEPLDFHRILTSSVSFTVGDVKYERSVRNLISQIWRNLNPKRRKLILPLIHRRFNNMGLILSCIPDAPCINSANNMIQAFSGGIFPSVKLIPQLIKNRHKIFFSRENNECIAVIRALVFGITMLDYFEVSLKNK